MQMAYVILTIHIHGFKFNKVLCSITAIEQFSTTLNNKSKLSKNG